MIKKDIKKKYQKEKNNNKSIQDDLNELKSLKNKEVAVTKILAKLLERRKIIKKKIMRKL